MSCANFYEIWNLDIKHYKLYFDVGYQNKIKLFKSIKFQNGSFLNFLKFKNSSKSVTHSKHFPFVSFQLKIFKFKLKSLRANRIFQFFKSHKFAVFYIF